MTSSKLCRHQVPRNLDLPLWPSHTQQQRSPDHRLPELKRRDSGNVIISIRFIPLQMLSVWTVRDCSQLPAARKGKGEQCKKNACHISVPGSVAEWFTSPKTQTEHFVILARSEWQGWKIYKIFFLIQVSTESRMSSNKWWPLHSHALGIKVTCVYFSK